MTPVDVGPRAKGRHRTGWRRLFPVFDDFLRRFFRGGFVHVDHGHIGSRLGELENEFDHLPQEIRRDPEEEDIWIVGGGVTMGNSIPRCFILLPNQLLPISRYHPGWKNK